MIPLPELLGSSQADGTAVANTTTPSSLIPSAARKVLAANIFDVIGRRFSLFAAGRVSNIVTSPGTLTLDLRFGSIAVFSSGAMALNVVAKTDVNWILEAELTLRVLGNGTTAQLHGQGMWTSHSVIGAPAPSAGGAGCHMLPYNAAPALGNGFDGTAAQILDLFATWSVANSGNSIQCHQFDFLVRN